MELSPGGGDGGTVIPFPVSDSTHTGAGSENQNTEGVVDSNFEIEPEMYDFSCFLEGDVVDHILLELKEMLKSAPLPSSGHNGHGVPEVVKEVAAEKNMEQLVQPPPSPPLPPPTPPQLVKPSINLSPGSSARLRWTEELHASFVDALKQLGGAFAATPKTILDIMDVECLSLHQVKSHLQKYRLGKKPCKDWKKLFRSGSSFSRALGGPSNPVPISQPPRAKNQRRRRAKPNKQEHGSLYLKIEAQKHVQRCLEAQRVYAKIAAGRMAANQNMGGYQFAAYQNAGGYAFGAKQDMGGCAFAANQNMGGYASAGRNIYPKNNLINGATMAPVPSFYPYQLNPYNAYTPAATVNAGISTARKPYQLQGIIEVRPHPLTKASFPTEAASGSYLQGSSSASGQSSGTAGMSDEEFVESFLIDFDEINGDFQNIQ